MIVVIEGRIAELLAQKFQEPEFEDCFPIETRLSAGNKLEVFIDSDSGISFQQCQKVSRYLESFIEEEGLLGEKYVIEVSSPGVGRPLMHIRQYSKNIGRKLEVKTHSGEKVTGQLTEVTDTGISIQFKTKRKEGKKTIRETVDQPIAFDDINKAVVKITF